MDATNQRTTRQEAPTAPTRLISALVILWLVSVLAGCADRAEAPFQAGQAAEGRKDLHAAAHKYRQAISASPQSEYGKKSGARLQVVKAEIERKAAETNRQKAEDAKAEAALRAVQLSNAKKIVRPKWYSLERDGPCTSKGLPPYKATFEGGTYSQNEMVAFDRGCRHLWGGDHNKNSLLWNVYCCSETSP